MSNNDEFYNVLAIVFYLCQNVLQNLNEYKTVIYKNKKLSEQLKNIEYVYMEYIMLNLSKLFSVTNSDKSGIKQLKKYAPKEIQQETDEMFELEKNFFEKIKSNRSKIVAHVDVTQKYGYYNMGFSELEINRQKEMISYAIGLRFMTGNEKDREQSLINKISKLQSPESSMERYSPIDFYSDLEKIETVVKKVYSLAVKINDYQYIITNEQR